MESKRSNVSVLNASMAFSRALIAEKYLSTFFCCWWHFERWAKVVQRQQSLHRNEWIWLFNITTTTDDFTTVDWWTKARYNTRNWRNKAEYLPQWIYELNLICIHVNYSKHVFNVESVISFVAALSPDPKLWTFLFWFAWNSFVLEILKHILLGQCHFLEPIQEIFGRTFGTLTFFRLSENTVHVVQVMFDFQTIMAIGHTLISHITF